jgi:hypothetical protein
MKSEVRVPGFLRFLRDEIVVNDWAVRSWTGCLARLFLDYLGLLLFLLFKQAHHSGEFWRQIADDQDHRWSHARLFPGLFRTGPGIHVTPNLPPTFFSEELFYRRTKPLPSAGDSLLVPRMGWENLEAASLED